MENKQCTHGDRSLYLHNERPEEILASAQSEYNELREVLVKHETIKRCSPDTPIFDQLFLTHNPTFYYDFDKAKRKLEMAKHLVEINEIARQRNTRIDRLRFKHLGLNGNENIGGKNESKNHGK